jgi:protein ImuB
MPFACIFVPDFPVQALLRVEPDLCTQAVAVLEGSAPLEKVFAINQSAREAGVELGMTKTQLEACTGLVLRKRSIAQEKSAHAALLDCAQSFSPRVEGTDHDIIILDLAGLEKLFGSSKQIAYAIALCARGFGLEPHVAVASNPDSAMLGARGFPGVTVIPEREESAYFEQLSVNVLPCEAEMQETLERWGIRTLGALAALPKVALSERLGQKGLRLQRWARGTAFRTLVPIEEPLMFEESVELEHSLVLLEPMAFLMNRMLEQICARLNARALATQELTLELELEEGRSVGHPERAAFASEGSGRAPAHNPGVREIAIERDASILFTRKLRLPVPLVDPKIFLKLLQLDLNAHPPGAPIKKILLKAEPARPRPAQNGLFLPPAPEPEKLELTLARIAGIVGEARVGSVEILDTHRPQGFQMRRFAGLEQLPRGNTSAHNGNGNGNAGGEKNVVTALRMFRPPVRASVTVRDGSPARIACHKKKDMDGHVLWVAGPWRFSGDWWEQEPWARDEWDIALQQENGIGLYRLVRDLLSGGWFVEGTYD